MPRGPKPKPPKRGPGRPTKLTAALAERIFASLRVGAFVEQACAAEGISKDTAYVWLKRGAREAEGPHRDFRDGVYKAQAQFEIAALNGLAGFGDEEWTSIAWRLERKFPDRWGRRDRRVLPDPDAALLAIEGAEAKAPDAKTDLEAARATLSTILSRGVDAALADIAALSPAQRPAALKMYAEMQKLLGGPKLTYSQVSVFMGGPPQDDLPPPSEESAA